MAENQRLIYLRDLSIAETPADDLGQFRLQRHQDQARGHRIQAVQEPDFPDDASISQEISLVCRIEVRDEQASVAIGRPVGMGEHARRFFKRTETIRVSLDHPDPFSEWQTEWIGLKRAHHQ